MVEKGAVKECVLEFGVLYLNNKTQWFLKTDLEKREPWAPCCCFVTLFSLLVIKLIHSIKMICSKRVWGTRGVIPLFKLNSVILEK